MYYYQHNIQDYRADTAHLTVIEHGIYRQLIDWYYLDERPIPKETQVVMRRLSLGSEFLHFLENILADFFILAENGYYHNRIEMELEAYHTQAAKNRVNGKLGGRPRKTQVVSENNPSGCQTKPKHNPNITLTKELITNKLIKEKVQKENATATRLPADWKPSDQDIHFCNTERPEMDIRNVAGAFRDYWIAKPGAAGRKLDWAATWRNWVRNQKAQPSTNAGKSVHEIRAETIRNLTGRGKSNERDITPSGGREIIHEAIPDLREAVR